MEQQRDERRARCRAGAALLTGQPDGMFQVGDRVYARKGADIWRHDGQTWRWWCSAVSYAVAALQFAGPGGDRY